MGSELSTRGSLTAPLARTILFCPDLQPSDHQTPSTNPPTMAAILAGNNVEEEYLWSCTLTGSSKEYDWNPANLEPKVEEEEEEKEGPKVKPSHRLLIKTAVPMPSAKKDEVTVVQIESEGYNKQTVTVPICAMKGGVDLQKYIDLLVPGNAKIKIIHGEGPIKLIGSHCVDYFGFKDDEEDSEDEEEGDTETEMETEEASTEEKGKKASPAKSPSTNKKSTPEKGDTEKKVTPSKEDSKKRKTSSETKSAEKKAKN